MAFRIEHLISFGIIIIVLGVVIVLAGLFLGAKASDSKTKIAVGGFIGPIPFGFGNDKDLIWIVIGMSLALILLWIFLNVRMMR
ncbi:DUF131 domain-containing protein [Candidatus Woesearchaeota archaeon]|nr:DUF131 domain-containing protein [Candidatus Woesearchaeota archaeon]